MANHKSAEKRASQNEKRRTRNRDHRSRMKTIIKKVETAVSAKESESAAGRLSAALRVLDKSASKGIIHRNKAARKKSRLTRKVNRLSSGT